MLHNLSKVFWWLVSSTLVLLAFSSIFLLHSVSGKKCPGKCMSNASVCKLEGGKVAGYCTNQQACCDFAYKKTGSCGAKMSKLTTAIFQSPDYPQLSKGDLTCQFQFAIEASATGLIVEFSEAIMDGPGYIKLSSCESDMIYLKGFPNWTPPAHCGNMTNYAAVIDLNTPLTKEMKELTVLAIMSSSKYKWSIKISQIFGNSNNTGDEGDEDLPEIPTVGDSLNELVSEVNTSSTFPLKEGFDEETGESIQEQLDRIMSILNIDQNYDIDDSDDYESDDYSESMVVNGEDGIISDVPWQASLRATFPRRLIKHLSTLKLKNCSIDEGIHFCGGSIISDRHILSATHCFLLGDKIQPWQSLSTMKVVLGDGNLCDEEKDGIQELKVDKVYFHYGYDTRALMNDVVVIKVKDKIIFNEKVQSIEMAKPGMDFQNQPATISGWGLTNLTSTAKGSRKPTAEQLQYADDLFIGNRTHCAKEQLKLFGAVRSKELIKHPKYSTIFNSLLCTYVRNGTKETGMVGQGDSGGPLIIKRKDEKGKNDSSPLLIGVISYMVPVPVSQKPHDISKYVDFYQSVAFYRKWIDLAMQ